MNNDSCTPSVQQSYNTPSQGVGPTVYGAHPLWRGVEWLLYTIKKFSTTKMPYLIYCTVASTNPESVNLEGFVFSFLISTLTVGIFIMHIGLLQWAGHPWPLQITYGEIFVYLMYKEIGWSSSYIH
jgi:hypothetical protein